MKLWPQYKACADGPYTHLYDSLRSSSFSMQVWLSYGDGKGFHTFGDPNDDRALRTRLEIPFGRGVSETATLCGWHNFFQARFRQPLYLKCVGKTRKQSYGMYAEPDQLERNWEIEQPKEGTPRKAPDYLSMLQGDFGALAAWVRLGPETYHVTRCEKHNFIMSFNPYPYYAKCKGSSLKDSIGNYKEAANIKLLNLKSRRADDPKYDLESFDWIYLGSKKIQAKNCDLHNFLESTMRWPAYVKCGSVAVGHMNRSIYPDPDRRTSYNNNYTD